MRSPRLAGVIFTIALGIAFAAPSKASAQGCELCRDATAGSTPQARRSLRLAIPLLGVPGIGIFAGALVLARRFKPGSNQD